MKQRAFLVPAIFTVGVVVPLFMLMQSPSFHAMRSVDFISIFAIGVTAGALLGLLVASRRRGEARG